MRHYPKFTFIEAFLGFMPDDINEKSLKGICYYDVEKQIAYFSDLVDVALLKLLSDRTIRKIRQ